MKKTYLIFILLTGIIGILFVFTSKNPTVVSTNPPINSTNVDPYLTLNLTLNKKVNPDKIGIEINPQVGFNLSWLDKQLTISHTSPLAFQTNYQLDVSYNNTPIYTLYFQTRPPSQTELNLLGEGQAASDFEFSQAQGEVLKDKPYLAKLPLETNSFKAVFDYDQNKVRIRFKNPTTGPEEKEALIKQIIFELQNHGVDANKIGYYVLEPGEALP